MHLVTITTWRRKLPFVPQFLGAEKLRGGNVSEQLAQSCYPME